MGIQVTLVLLVIVWMGLQVLLGYQDSKAGRVSQEMSSLPVQVLLAHLAAQGQ